MRIKNTNHHYPIKGKIMLKSKLNKSTAIILLIAAAGLTGCSTISQVGKKAKSLTSFGGNKASDIDNNLIVPPSLKLPAGTVSSNSQARAPQQPQRSVNSSRAPQPRQTAFQSNENFYIIVGTYPDQLEALDTFTRLSSIGLKGATMESRRTKTGSLLHMVRLGPYKRQEDIDKAKDSLTNTGLSQFKIVKN